MSRRVIVILIMLLAVYGLLRTFHPGGLMAYIFPSACWALLALATIWACGFKRIKSWVDKRVTIVAALVAIFYIIIYMDIGLFTGFGRSPLSFTPKYLMLNFILVSSTLLGMEFSRGYIIKSFGRRRPFLTIGLVTLLYSFISVSIIGLLSYRDPLALSKFLGTGLLPIIAINLLASYLALIGGPIASLAYRAPLMALTWFSPILPELSWGTEALLGVMVPAISFLAINLFIPSATLRRSGIPAEVKGFGARKEGSSLRSWMAISIFFVLVVWTSTGLLGIQPTTVLSGSMRPTMDVGDMAIVRDVPTDSIEVGDIIQYWDDGEMVIHRVVEVNGGGNGGLFVTQGDANDEPDMEPVHPSQVRGEVILTIPELGWVPIGAKAFIGGVWSFVSANPMVVVLIIALGICVLYLYRTRSSRRWRAPKWRKKARVGGKIVPLIVLLLIGTAASGLAYSHWSDNVQIEGTVKMGSWSSEIKCYKVCCCCCDIDTRLSPDRRTLHIDWHNVTPCKPLWAALKIHNKGTVPICLKEPNFEFDPDVEDRFKMESWFFGPDRCSWDTCCCKWKPPCPSKPPIQVDPCQSVIVLIKLRSLCYCGQVKISISIVDECWAKCSLS